MAEEKEINIELKPIDCVECGLNVVPHVIQDKEGKPVSREPEESDNARLSKEAKAKGAKVIKIYELICPNCGHKYECPITATPKPDENEAEGKAE